MRALILLLCMLGSLQAAAGCCGEETGYSLPELLYKGYDQPIFTCEVLSSWTDKKFEMYAKVQVQRVYFGEVSSRLVTLYTGRDESLSQMHSSVGGGYRMTVGRHYLVYGYRQGAIISSGTNICSRRPLPIPMCLEEARDPAFRFSEVNSEMAILEQMSAIFKSRTTTHYTALGERARMLAEGDFVEGKAVGTWKFYGQDESRSGGHPYKVLQLDSGNVRLYTRGLLTYRKTVLPELTLEERFSFKDSGRLSQRIESIPKAEGFIFVHSQNFYPNGQLQKVEDSIKEVCLPFSTYLQSGRVNEHREYYADGTLKAIGSFMPLSEVHAPNELGQAVGIWKTFSPNGELLTEQNRGNGHRDWWAYR